MLILIVIIIKVNIDCNFITLVNVLYDSWIKKAI